MRTRLLFHVALGLLAATLAHAAESPIPIAAFFGNPHVRGAQLAPDGKRLAMVVNNDQGYDQLGVVNLKDGTMKVVASFSDADVGRFQWVNNGRLLYSSRDKHTARGELRYADGLFAVNSDGSGYRQLAAVGTGAQSAAPALGRRKLPLNTFMLDQPGAQDTDSAYVQTFELKADASIDRINLFKLNTVTGIASPVQGPGRTRRWWLDARGEPALALTVDERTETLYYRDPGSGNWRRLGSRVYLAYADDSPAASGDANGDAQLAQVIISSKREELLNFTPLGFTPAGELYVTSHKKRDKDALFAYDLAAGKMADRPLVELDAYDFDGELVAGAGKLLGVRYTVDAATTTWFDPAMKQAQQAVDRLLPDRVNVLSVGSRSETPFVLVTSWSDRQPPVFLLFDRSTGKLSMVGASRPAIPPARMSRQALVRIPARDGQPIPTWMTVPAHRPGEQLPMVVLVHGGPQVRGHEWEWNAASQFLASRGYAVLEPEFRGSAGYGSAHLRAGWKQWGLAMQDDLADAARWAIAEGIADPHRICIGGGGYGGYAALMGLIRDPGLYRCGMDWAGVTDLKLLYTGSWTSNNDMSNAWKDYGMPLLIGDPARDAAQFAATSPLQQAARVTQPLLLAYGDDDLRVPAYHGRKFYDAVRPTNPHVEWVLYKKEGYGGGLDYDADDRRLPGYRSATFYDAVKQSENAVRLANRDVAGLYPADGDDLLNNGSAGWIVHEKDGAGWDLVQTRVDFWGRVEAFLQQHIGTRKD